MATKSVQAVPRWKQGVAITCAAYMLLVWILPLFMTPFVNVLPFVHERGVLERFFVSAMGSVVVIVVLVAMDPRRIQTLKMLEPSGPRYKKVVHWLGTVLGLLMFTYFAAELSPNSLGILSQTLPSEQYRQRVVLESVTYYGSRNKSVSLEFKDPHRGRTQRLVLSKRLFAYPHFVPGDVLELQGKSGPIGVYITDFKVVESPPPAHAGLTLRSTGPARKAAQAG